MEDDKKATTSNASVAADGKQSLNTFTEKIMPEYEREVDSYNDGAANGSRVKALNSNTRSLHTVSMAELYDTVYQPRATMVDGLLYSGTYLFAGAPKIGKSFFMLQLGYHVSTGKPLWDYRVNKGSVLYLALEDDYSRLQKRLYRMYGVDSTDKLHFSTNARPLENGLDEQMDLFIQKHVDTRLIIIDTLQRIRPSLGDAYSYANDYEVVTHLKQLGDRYNVCILVVHHTRKQESNDSFETISGTTGLLGAADGAFVMYKKKRTVGVAVLDVVGRDQQDQRLHLERDHERCVWLLTDMDTKIHREKSDPLLKTIADFLLSASMEWTGNATQLIEKLQLDIQPNVLTRRLNVNVDILWNEYGIRYESIRTYDSRMIRLSLKDKDMTIMTV